VQSGEIVAQQLVALNGARIVSLEVQKSGDEGTTVVVVIELDGVQAQATASNANGGIQSDTNSVGECSTLRLWPNLMTHSS
jgi:hypothetical protein